MNEDVDKLDATLKTIPDEETARKVISLNLTLTATVLRQLNGGQAPDTDQVRAIAATIAEKEQWAGPTADEVEQLLSKILDDGDVSDLPVENAVILGFVVCAFLLSSGRRDDEKWWNHLDRVEAVLEAQG